MIQMALISPNRRSLNKLQSVIHTYRFPPTLLSVTSLPAQTVNRQTKRTFGVDTNPECSSDLPADLQKTAEFTENSRFTIHLDFWRYACVASSNLVGVAKCQRQASEVQHANALLGGLSINASYLEVLIRSVRG